MCAVIVLNPVRLIAAQQKMVVGAILETTVDNGDIKIALPSYCRPLFKLPILRQWHYNDL